MAQFQRSVGSVDIVPSSLELALDVVRNAA
jgi:hypothetical protein